ncbi:LOW QUALITY PROTEIN: hypothetical protein HJC23_013640, partial [Cyclotella cryptica]
MSSRFYSYDMTTCMGTEASGKFFPDWSPGNEGCLVDERNARAPKYMLQSKMWLYDTLDQCCTAHFSYKLSDCKGESVVGTNKWYVDWSTLKCIKDCSLDTADGCGGFANKWDI